MSEEASELDEIKEAERVVHRLLPERKARAQCLSMFVDAITIAHQHGPSKWCVHLRSDRDRLRLIVGSLIVATVQRGRLWLALDTELLSASPDLLSRLEGLNGWTWDEDDYPRYKAVPSRNGYYMPGTNHSKEWSVVMELHRSLVVRAAKKYRTLNIRSWPNHSAAVLNVLRRELGQSVPSPILPDLAGDEQMFPEEIPLSVPVVEGACRVIQVNAYERSRSAREECLRTNGTRCVVCGLDMAEIYGPVAAGFIHVHHRVPLSEIREGYEVDPQKDLVPVCPNCHAVMHLRRPPFALDEMKQFIEVER